MDTLVQTVDGECTEGFAICVRHFRWRGREGGEYAKLVLISEKATELNEQRKEEERSSPPPQHHADSVRRAAGRHGQLQAQKEEEEEEGEKGKSAGLAAGFFKVH